MVLMVLSAWNTGQRRKRRERERERERNHTKEKVKKFGLRVTMSD
jgi:hypothetical protein